MEGTSDFRGVKIWGKKSVFEWTRFGTSPGACEKCMHVWKDNIFSLLWRLPRPKRGAQPSLPGFPREVLGCPGFGVLWKWKTLRLFFFSPPFSGEQSTSVKLNDLETVGRERVKGVLPATPGAWCFLERSAGEQSVRSSQGWDLTQSLCVPGRLCSLGCAHLPRLLLHFAVPKGDAMSENQAEAFQRSAKVLRSPGLGIMMGLFMVVHLRCESSPWQGRCRREHGRR